MPHEPPSDFRAFSAALGQDPLRVQGAGGNTSIKLGETMWIKASGTELADAATRGIFVPVDRPRVLAEIDGAGDGSCRSAVTDTDCDLRPSIETTFHGLMDWMVVAHTHSVATIVHAISTTGRDVARRKLADLPVAFVPYRKPGLPLTRAIREVAAPETQIFVLENHGLIVCGHSVADTARLMDLVEKRLAVSPVALADGDTPETEPIRGYDWFAPATALGRDSRLFDLVRAGSYYPDHVVFLGCGLPTRNASTERAPAIVRQGDGVLARADATSSQMAMLQCLADVLMRLPVDWDALPIGAEAEMELLRWDAEKYRQALAARARENP